jgi:hypothetical protein
MPSSAEQSGVRLALVQPADAPVIIESVAHAADRVAGVITVRNRSQRAIAGLVVAFTIVAAPTATAPAFRHVETVSLTLGPRQAATIEVPGIPLRLLHPW